MNRYYRPTSRELVARDNQDACKFIERAKKMRALDVNPKSVGYSERELKSFKVNFNRYITI